MVYCIVAETEIVNNFNALEISNKISKYFQPSLRLSSFLVVLAVQLKYLKNLQIDQQKA